MEVRCRSLMFMATLVITITGCSGSPSGSTPTEADPPLGGKIVVKTLGHGGTDTGLSLVSLSYEAPSPDTTLKDVDLVLELWQENGEKQEIKRYWAEWLAGEVKRIEFPPNKTAYPEKIEVRRKAMQGDKRVSIKVVHTK